MPGNPHVFAVRVYDIDGTTLFSSSVRVIIRNESTNEKIEKNTASSEAVFNLSNFTSGWTGGDRISSFVLYQGYQATASKIVQDTGGTQVNLTLVALSVTPSLRYFTPQ